MDMKRIGDPEASAAGGDGGKFLTFFLDHEEFGIRILTVREIIGIMPITQVPQTPHYVRGVVNLRGQVIPVVDLRLKFGMSPVEDTDETCIIVVQTAQVKLGVLVDRVSEVLDIRGREIVETPTLGTEINTDYILGFGKHEDSVSMLLEMDMIFPAGEPADFGMN